ncbi:YdaS family helix-turn-helix protein [Shewanella sp. MM_2022_3]|uniref:YdaS family helix-turn-helix protein n=1 Tax=Shewanella sp. MM_2022_3 TaxID=2923280 RepID=UPI001F4BF77C|nr:YdaS family helix-turn-helix protein [Shewanella sp. MM_2022_3]MCH7421280.1 helix-turn-helix domain-containing protein [Shewanella sp. MM_2022_3]
MTKKIRDLIPKGLPQSAIADACNVTQQAVVQWLNNNQIPARRVKAFSKITGIAPEKLNPEVFGDSSESAA